MFSKYKAPDGFDKMQAQAERLKELAGFKAIYLAYSKQLDAYHLTFDHWIVSPTRQAMPVFEDRGYGATELADLMQRAIGFHELERRLSEEEDACQRYRPKDPKDFYDIMGGRRDRAMIMEAVAQTRL